MRGAAVVTPKPPLHPAPSGERAGIAVVGRFSLWEWGQHPDEAYMADALESLGIPVYRIDQSYQMVPSQVPSEWALFTGGSARLLFDWRRTHRTALWTLDWLPSYPERHHIIDAGRAAEIFLSSDRYDWSRYRIERHAYLPAACESISTPFAPNPTRPAAFVGAIYSDRRKRIAEIVRKHGGTVLARRGEWLYRHDLASFVQGTKVIVGDNVINDCNGYWSSRNYVIPGAGGFLLTPQVPGLDRHFRPNGHLGVYGSVDELEELLERWIRGDDQREQVRRAGFEHVRRNHNWRVRAQELLAVLARLGKRAQ